eukprot:9151134-Pyramimonas_sp.AAC.1
MRAICRSQATAPSRKSAICYLGICQLPVSFFQNIPVYRSQIWFATSVPENAECTAMFQLDCTPRTS